MKSTPLTIIRGIPRGLPRDFSRGVSKGERAFALVWSPSARVSRAGEIIIGKNTPWLATGILIFFSIATANAAPLTDKNHKLTTLQHSIATIKADLNHEQQLRAASEKKLKMAELSEATSLKKLTQTQHHFDHQQQDLKELNQKAKKSQQAIHQQYEYLKEQIRAAYMLGHPPLLKLLLDESDSSRISRMRMYYHYLARSEERRVGKECRSRWSP